MVSKSITTALFAITTFTPLQAAVHTATNANLGIIFANARDGDTIKVVGTIGSAVLQNRNFGTALTIDASQAVFSDSLTLRNISGVNFVGGIYGSTTKAMRTSRAVMLVNSSKVNFAKTTFLGTGAGMGLTVQNSSQIDVSSSSFKNLRLGLGVTSSSNVRISSSAFTGMTSDGINIAGSHFVTATGNRCNGSAPSPGAHADCIQLWSILGTPVQSDITLTDNYAHGSTQGFTSFTPQNGGGLRITMIGNVVNTSMPQGIACYGCNDSIFRDNILSTLPGSQWRTSMNIVGGNNNIVEDNIIGSRPALSLASLGNHEVGSELAAASSFMSAQDRLAGEDLARLAAADLMLAASDFSGIGSAVPEPASWAQMLAGFGLVGFIIRTRRRSGYEGAHTA